MLKFILKINFYLAIFLIGGCSLFSDPTIHVFSRSEETTNFTLLIHSSLLGSPEVDGKRYNSYDAKQILDSKVKGLESCFPKSKISYRDPRGPTITVPFTCPTSIDFPYTDYSESYVRKEPVNDSLTQNGYYSISVIID